MSSMESYRGNVIWSWFVWQFYEVPSFLLKVWENYFVFATNFFSIPLLLKTFFSPWHKYQWRYPKGFDIQEFFNTFVSNTFSRIIGVFMRIILIIAGLILEIVIVIAGGAVFLAWILAPFIAVALIVFPFIF